MLALAKTCHAEERECTADEAAELVTAERVGFYFNMLNVLANRGRSANRQLFFSLAAGSGQRPIAHGDGGLRTDEHVPVSSHV